MTRYTADSLLKALQNQLNRLDSRIDHLDKRSKKLSTWRLLTFLLGTGLSYGAATTYNPWLFGITVFLFAVTFGYLVRIHRRVDHFKQVFSIWRRIRKQHIGRMQLDWDAIPPADDRPVAHYEEHPFGTDLNIVGPHSIHRLVDTSIYEGGSSRLRDWLLETHPDPESIGQRHRLVRELKPMALFRDRLELKAMMTRSRRTENDWTMKQLLQWLRIPDDTNYQPALVLLGALSAVNMVLGLLWLLGLAKPYVIITFILYLVAYNFNSGKVKGLFESAYQMDKLLNRFSSILLYLENFPYRPGSALDDFCSLYHKNDSRPSRYLGKVVRMATAASLQKSQIGWILVNGLLPWDLYYASRMKRLKSDLEPRLGRWMDRFYELEALCSLSNFAWLNPGYTFHKPREGDTDNPFEATGLGHPLIPKDRKVTNDLSIPSTGSILLITGSNMAGKSTFLRTIGVNLALCFAGAPVNARTFNTIPFRLFTSINVKDSLDRGLSHFYAEVKRLRRLLAELERSHSYPLFFFVDEIYRGTNNRERLLGSEAFLKNVAGSHGIGVVSTHDLELARLEEQIPQLSNWHFEETIEEGKMSFEYKLKPGPCPTTNALKIMRNEGLPVANTEEE